jgi:hypothetical protein
MKPGQDRFRDDGIARQMPGPGAYPVTTTLGKQPISTRASQPQFSLGFR